MKKSLVSSALLVVVVMAFAVAAGAVWQWQASPALWEVRGDGIVLTEDAASEQFSVVILFLVAGAVVGVLWGALAAWRLPALGWWITPLVVVGSLAAAVVAWQVGFRLGPPDPATVGSLSDGDRVPSQVDVEGLGPFLVWPIFGLVGVLLATIRRGDDEDEPYRAEWADEPGAAPVVPQA